MSNLDILEGASTPLPSTSTPVENLYWKQNQMNLH